MKEVEYIRSLFVKEDEVQRSIEQGLAERGMPQISVPPEVGQTLYLLAKIVGAKKILEIGALGGYSSIWLAKALPADGKLISLELKQEHADFALENVQKAGLGDKAEFRVGDAKELLESLKVEGEKFDFFFIDADKPNYVYYLEKAIELAQPGAIITLDNLLFGGRVLDPSDDNPAPNALRKVNQMLANDPRLESILLTIGDGVGLARVK
ncbi:O-methyltransferase [Thermoflavimicrobium dichotomicum]|uniref:Predicted O-methyltransferase YrrM n=1 Tax=Thermoflavimicrobium dichotomicum TaxID=46223 RepID=A0A1I3NEG3_9BACL|nr:O-methyltransferase [Thermoflavimicrobium dichotomicum]SFJ07693.1 Predicted O-methyltransferase YrrM [Thermoflavimicrobium dichotomicum]